MSNHGVAFVIEKFRKFTSNCLTSSPSTPCSPSAPLIPGLPWNRQKKNFVQQICMHLFLAMGLALWITEWKKNEDEKGNEDLEKRKTYIRSSVSGRSLGSLVSLETRTKTRNNVHVLESFWCRSSVCVYIYRHLSSVLSARSHRSLRSHWSLGSRLPILSVLSWSSLCKNKRRNSLSHWVGNA